jgi:hypothetical protein
MKIEMSTAIVVLLILLLVCCWFGVLAVAAADAQSYPPLPTPAPTMDPWDDIIYPPPSTPPAWPIPYSHTFYLPFVAQGDQNE